MPKLYKAVDRLDDRMSLFLVYDDGMINVATHFYSDSWHIEIAKIYACDYPLSRPSRFNDAIDPVLIAEW